MTTVGPPGGATAATGPEPTVGAAFAVGLAYEATLTAAARRDGAHYTPVDVAEGLVALALAWIDGPAAPRCWDPSCGGGVFLVAVADALVRRGVDPREVVDRCVVGVDLDPGAVAASRAALVAWACGQGVEGVVPQVVEGDGLDVDLGPFDLVVGNPPFRNQLDRTTARDEVTARRRRSRLGPAATGYVDDAVLFLLAATRALRPGGVACLVQPRSTLSAQHADGARREVVAPGRRVAAAWFPGERVFDADVDVWAPFVVADGAPRDGAVSTYIGRTASGSGRSILAPIDGDWAGLVADATGVPDVSRLVSGGRLGDVAWATAGFRDEYYGVLAHTTDDEPGRGMRVVTTGMVDPAVCRWGDAPARFGKRTWRHPWLDLAALDAADPRIGRWVRRLAVPKVLVASQTRVVEAVADPVGDLVPVTPTVAVVPADPDDLRLLVSAVLVSPPVAAWVRRRRAGSGMSSSAVRIGAKDLAEVPLPADRDRWVAASHALTRGADWATHAAAMCDAYGLEDHGLARWWLGQLPRAVRASMADPD